MLPNDPSNLDSSGLPKKTWPLGAVIEGEWSYIRREADVREELFHLRADASEAAQPGRRSGRSADARADARRAWTVSRPARSCPNGFSR